jgi:2-dehydropantoate 2-reductase
MSSIEDLDSSEFPQVIFLTVKAYDVEAAAKSLLAATPASSPVVCFTNGIGSEALLASVLGEQRVISATLTTAVQTTAPGEVRIARERGIGLAGDHGVIPALIESFRRAGMRTVHYSHPPRMKWSKLLVNILANATSAILGWTPGQVYGHRGIYRLELEALREAVRVIRELGFWPQNLPGVPVGWLGLVLFLPARVTQGFFRKVIASARGEKPPSLHYDIGRGRSEIRWLNGAVVDWGQKLDLPTPANRVLTEELLALVEGKEDPNLYRNHPERLLQIADEAGVPGIRGYNRTSS